MKTSIIASAVTLIAVFVSTQVMAAEILARFNGGIGETPISSVAGVANDDGSFPNVNRNDVRGVPPGGQPWVIARLSATVKNNGRIHAKGEGLLLAGGNGIGTSANASVFATLFCGAAEFSSNPAGVPLDANGDFIIDDTLTPTPPDPCDNQVLLIRTANGGRWFAAGIPKE